jgi:hypothetical protein
VPEPLGDEPELDVPELLVDELELEVPEPLLDEPELDGEDVPACVAEADEGDAFEPHPMALTKNKIATNKEIRDIRSPWVSAAPKDNLTSTAFDYSRVSA